MLASWMNPGGLPGWGPPPGPVQWAPATYPRPAAPGPWAQGLTAAWGYPVSGAEEFDGAGAMPGATGAPWLPRGTYGLGGGAGESPEELRDLVPGAAPGEAVPGMAPGIIPGGMPRPETLRPGAVGPGMLREPAREAGMLMHPAMVSLRLEEYHRRTLADLRQLQEGQRAVVQRLERLDDLVTRVLERLDHHLGRRDA